MTLEWFLICLAFVAAVFITGVLLADRVLALMAGSAAFAAMAGVGLIDLLHVPFGGKLLLPSISAAVITSAIGIVGCAITYYVSGPLTPGIDRKSTRLNSS